MIFSIYTKGEGVFYAYAPIEFSKLLFWIWFEFPWWIALVTPWISSISYRFIVRDSKSLRFWMSIKRTRPKAHFSTVFERFWYFQANSNTKTYHFAEPIPSRCVYSWWRGVVHGVFTQIYSLENFKTDEKHDLYNLWRLPWVLKTKTQ